MIILAVKEPRCYLTQLWRCRCGHHDVVCDVCQCSIGTSSSSL